MVEHSPKIDRERIVGLLVEAEVLHCAWLVPAGIIVVARGLVQAQDHVVVRPNSFGRIEHTPLEGAEDIARWSEHGRGPGPHVNQAAEVRDTHPEPLEVADRADLL